MCRMVCLKRYQIFLLDTIRSSAGYATATRGSGGIQARSHLKRTGRCFVVAENLSTLACTTLCGWDGSEAYDVLAQVARSQGPIREFVFDFRGSVVCLHSSAENSGRKQSARHLAGILRREFIVCNRGAITQRRHDPCTFGKFLLRAYSGCVPPCLCLDAAPEMRVLAGGEEVLKLLVGVSALN